VVIPNKPYSGNENVAVDLPDRLTCLVKSETKTAEVAAYPEVSPAESSARIAPMGFLKVRYVFLVSVEEHEFPIPQTDGHILRPDEQTRPVCRPKGLGLRGQQRRHASGSKQLQGLLRCRNEVR
jgi:hypothetical protein